MTSADAFDVYLPRASSNAGNLDLLFASLLAVSALVVLALAVLAVVFAACYRTEAEVPRRAQPPSRVLRVMEIGWTLLPLLAFIGLFSWAAALYLKQQRPPKDAMVINVVAKQWMWKFQHPGGQREIDQLHLPLGQPVRLVMTSQDVIHSLYVPAFRLKQDLVPGRYTSLWVTPTRVGRYRLFCAEFCGTGHSDMTGQVIVLEPQRYQDWLAQHDSGASLAAQGEELFLALGCSGCHAPGASVPAPKLAGLYGRPVALRSGQVVTADRAYLRDSILLPERQVVAGFEPIMPSFQDRISEADVLRLIAYIQSLGSEPSASGSAAAGGSR